MTTVIEGEDSELGGDHTSGYRRLEHSDQAGRKRGASRLQRVIDWFEAFDARDARPLLFAVSMTAGAAVYISLPFESPVWASVVALVSASVCIWLARPVWRAPFLLTLAVVVLGVAAGFTAGKISASTKAGTPITAVVGPAQLEGWVDGVDPGTKGPRLRIRVHAISGLSEDQTPQYVRLTHRTRLEVGPGRFVRCRAVIRPPPAPSIPGDYNFQRQAFFDGLDGVGYVQGRCRGGALGRPTDMMGKINLQIGAWRRSLARYVNDAAGERAGGFAAALSSGDRSYLANEDAEALRGAGLAHLLAISGLHMGIVGGMIFALIRQGLAFIEPLALRMPVKKPAAAGALMASAIYLVLSGASVSTQRAFIMSAVVFGAILFDRAAISFRSFAIAMVIVVGLRPESVVTPGFQMSFAATAGLIATYEVWSRRREWRSGTWARVSFAMKSLAVTSFVGAAATAPYALYHFDRVAGMGLLANLLAMPIVTFVSAPAAALSLLLAPFGLSELGLELFGLSLEWILAIAHWCDGLASSDFTFPVPMPAAALVGFSLALAGGVIGKGGWRLVFAGIGTAFALNSWAGSAAPTVHWAPNGDVYIVDGQSGAQRVAFVDGDGLGPLRYSDLEVARDCRARDCDIRVGERTVSLLQDAPRCRSSGSAQPTLTLVAETSVPARSDQNGASCTPSITWPEARAFNGTTATLNRDGTIKIASPPCGHRPWAICPVPEDEN